MKHLLESLFSPRRRALVAALAGSLTAAVSLAQAPAPTAAPIRIGMIEGLSGPFANTGEAVFRNLVWATERVNARGGVKLPGGNRPLLIERFDSKGCARRSTATSPSSRRAIRRPPPAR
jgi:branched-chain amino acid transport system substrate-binding protein